MPLRRLPSSRSAALLLVVAAAPAAAPAADSVSTAAFTVQHGHLPSVSGCRNDYTLHRPARVDSGLAVMIVPGFMRDRDRMRGWAGEIANRGMSAVTMDFCQPTAFDGRHAENARDMIAVREALGFEAIVYVGHSAGGLASLLAAAEDPAARGMLLLDPVDFGDLAEDAARRAVVPALVLLAKPGLCNLRRNIRHALPNLARATVVAVAGASHCDFEWPPDGLGRAACDFGRWGRDARLRSEREIRALGLGFLDALRATAEATPGDDERHPH